MGFLKDVLKGLGTAMSWIGKAIGWIGDPENMDEVKQIYGIFMLIFQALGGLNEPVPKRQRPYLARCFIDMLREMDDEDVQMLLNAKKDGSLDKLTNGEVDMLTGMALGGFVDSNKGREPKRGKGR